MSADIGTITRLKIEANIAAMRVEKHDQVSLDVDHDEACNIWGDPDECTCLPNFYLVVRRPIIQEVWFDRDGEVILDIRPLATTAPDEA